MARNGLTQQALGDCIGVSQRAVGKWLAGDSRPGPAVALKLADYFGLPIDVLTDDEQDLPGAGASGGRVEEEASSLSLSPLPDWWTAMPPAGEIEKLRMAIPHVYERLKIAAERLYMGDLAARHGRKRTPEQEHPLTDAFADLRLQGTGFTSQPGFQVLADAYTHELHLLRTQPLEERLAEQAREITRTRSMLEEFREWLLGTPAESAAAKAKLDALKAHVKREDGPAENRRQA